MSKLRSEDSYNLPQIKQLYMRVGVGVKAAVYEGGRFQLQPGVSGAIGKDPSTSLSVVKIWDAVIGRGNVRAKNR